MIRDVISGVVILVFAVAFVIFVANTNTRITHLEAWNQRMNNDINDLYKILRKANILKQDSNDLNEEVLRNAGLLKD